LLEKRFHLLEAVVVDTRPTDPQLAVNRALGNAAAAYLERSLDEDSVIGITWGSTLSSMVASVRPFNLPDAQVVQVNGGLGQPESEVHATDLCRRLAHALGCHLTLLPAPGIVANQAAREALLADGYVRRAMDLFPRLDLVFAGIGAPTPDSVLMSDGSILNSDELASLQQAGAVGDIALRFFDSAGAPVVSPIDARVIGISLAELKKVRRVVGVAGGPQKLAAVLGALRGGLIKVLITDNLTAEALCQMEEKETYGTS
jgi:DNA-binding transcriptional regulator LsrR (DeoR family)